MTVVRALLDRARARRRLLLVVVAVPLAAIFLAGCSSPANTHESGGNGDQAGTLTGGCSDLLGTLNDPNGNGNRGLQPAGTDSSGKATPDDCARLAAGNQTSKDVLAVAEQAGQNRIAINIVWTLFTGYLVMFMQAGFALVEAGFTRKKNAAHTMMMNFMVYGLGMLGYFVAGFAFQFGGLGSVGGAGSLGGTHGLPPNGEFTLPLLHIGTCIPAGATTQQACPVSVVGTSGFFLSGTTYDVGIAVLFLFQMVFMDTAATIPTGAMAERWKWTAFAAFGFFVSTCTYPIFGNWAWGGGWLYRLGIDHGFGNGYADFAGSGVVHSVGGWMALAGALALGPRIGKYNKDGSSNTIPGHNFTLALLGCFILAFGWFGFNPGSTLGASGFGFLRIGLIAVNTMLAGAAGSLSAMLYIWWRTGKPDGGMTANGLLAGLVAITAPSGFVSPIFACIIGLIAGVLVCVSVWFFDVIAKVDDPVGAISVHGVCGAWGVLSVGLFADGTSYYGGWNLVTTHGVTGIFFSPTIGAGQLLAQVIGVLANFMYVVPVSYFFFKLCDKVMGLRTDPASEIGGLDIPEIGMVAYPEDWEADPAVYREYGIDHPAVTPVGV